MQAATPEADDLLPQNGARVSLSCICNTASPPVVKREGRSCEAQSTRTGEGGPTTGPGEATMPMKWRRSSAGEAALAQAQRRQGVAQSSCRLSDGASDVGPQQILGERRGGSGHGTAGEAAGRADDGEHRNRFEDMCFGVKNGQWIDRVWLKSQRSSTSGATFMLDARWGSSGFRRLDMQKSEARNGPRGEGEPGGGGGFASPSAAERSVGSSAPLPHVPNGAHRECGGSEGPRRASTKAYAAEQNSGDSWNHFVNTTLLEPSSPPRVVPSPHGLLSCAVPPGAKHQIYTHVPTPTPSASASRIAPLTAPRATAHDDMNGAGLTCADLSTHRTSAAPAQALAHVPTAARHLAPLSRSLHSLCDVPRNKFFPTASLPYP
ncbi:hypothetical protein B0H13DRAFT_1922680 [Mycena leptocephala]|nr:hypothetical protein B0H13DRAFT_1922680 [Mycena leptocephala]